MNAKSRPIPRLTQWWMLRDREPGDRAVVWVCAAILVLYFTGVIR